MLFFFFFFNDTATTEIYTLSLHDALPICLDVYHLCFIVLTKRTQAGCYSKTAVLAGSMTGKRYRYM